MELAGIQLLLNAAAEELRDEEEPEVFGAAYASLLATADHEAVLSTALPLRAGSVEEQTLYARLVAQLSHLSAQHRLEEVEALLKGTQNPKVLRWLIVAIREARSSAGLGWLRELAEHPSAKVRFSVPDALSACASDLEAVWDALLTLSGDADDDVRWSAVYELNAWAQDSSDERLRLRLDAVSLNDVSAAVRRAAQGLPPGG